MKCNGIHTTTTTTTSNTQIESDNEYIVTTIYLSLTPDPHCCILSLKFPQNVFLPCWWRERDGLDEGDDQGREDRQDWSVMRVRGVRCWCEVRADHDI